LRLTKTGHKLGLASNNRLELLEKKEAAIEAVKNILLNARLEPDEVNGFLTANSSAAISERTRAGKILLRPGITINALIEAVPALGAELASYDQLALEQAEIQIKYDTYIQKEKDLAQRMGALEDLGIPEAFDYHTIVSLGTEAQQKLTRIRPKTLGQASG